MLNKELLMMGSATPKVTFFVTKVDESEEGSHVRADISYGDETFTLEFGFGWGSTSKTVDYKGSYFTFKNVYGTVQGVKPSSITYVKEGQVYHCDGLEPGMTVDILLSA